MSVKRINNSKTYTDPNVRNETEVTPGNFTIEDYYNNSETFTYTINFNSCRACQGKGYIENSRGDLKICPVCNGTGINPGMFPDIIWYNCSNIWIPIGITVQI